jgi:proteic killer suppression protein
MIRSFGEVGTADIFNGKPSKGARKTLPMELHRAASRKLDFLAHARSVDVLKSPPGNRLEALRGDWAAFWSIRINDQFRIVFQWRDDGPWAVRIVDYHS